MNLNAKKFSLLAATALLLVTGGCFDTTEDFTLNPDGSGKVVHECTFQPVNLNMGNNENQDPGIMLTNAIREVLDNAKGVDAWQNVTFKTLDDGRTYFKGTAYFKDISKLDIPNQTMLDFNWVAAADGGGVLTLRTNKSSEPENLGGGMTMHGVKKVKTPAKDLTPEEAAKKLKQERMQYQQSKPMLAGILGPMKHTVTLHLPGKVSSSSNFGKDDAGNLTIKFEGAKLMTVMDKLVADDEWCKKHNGTGMDDMQDSPLADEEMNQFIFGENAPVEATVTAGAAPLFDYATEVAAAKTEYAATRQALAAGSSSPEVVAAPATGGVKHISVAGVQLIMASDENRDLRPFNESPSYTVSLLVEFPGAVQSVSDESAVEVATADDGASLLLESEWDRKVHFPRLAKDKTAAIMEFKLNRPASGVKGLKELSGHLQYRVSNGTKDVDLGLDGLKEGAAGKALEASIKSIGEGWQKNGSQTLTLHLQVNLDDIKSVSLVVDGNKTQLQQVSSSSSPGECDLGLNSNEAFPAKGQLVVEMYDKVQVYTAPFKLENITLLGASMDGSK